MESWSFSTNPQPRNFHYTPPLLITDIFDGERMPGSTRKLPVWLPILVLLIAMSLYSRWRFTGEIVISSCRRAGRNGASKSGVGNAYPYRLFKPRRLRFAKRAAKLLSFTLHFYGLSLGGMNYLFYRRFRRCRWYCGRWNFTGPLAVALFFIRRPVRFYLGRTGCAWALVPAAVGQDMSHVVLPGPRWRGAGACWAVYILAPASEQARNMVRPRWR